MLKAWTVDAGFMDGPKGFNGLATNFVGCWFASQRERRFGAGAVLDWLLVMSRRGIAQASVGTNGLTRSVTGCLNY